MEDSFEKILLKDFRESEDIFHGGLKKEKGWDTPSERLKIYNEKWGRKPHADHSQLALESYQKYDCFKEKYRFETEEIYYQDEEKISADLLTNAAIVESWKMIRKKEIKMKPESEAVVNAFYTVSYTVGNFCPIWYNSSPGRYTLNDNIWDKLKKGFFYNNKSKCGSIKTRSDKNGKKFKQGLFMILPEEDPKNVIRKLYLMDYYDCHWRLRHDYTYQDTKDMNEESFISFLSDTTKLIVQRGYRILNKYYGNVFNHTRVKELEKIFENIGLVDLNCIYSKKNKNENLQNIAD